MNEAELGFELKNALARIEALEAALRDATQSGEPVAMMGGVHGVALVRHIEAMLPAARTEYHTPLYKRLTPQSPPVFKATQKSAESDPAVTPDRVGGDAQCSRIEQLEAALREIANWPPSTEYARDLARAALDQSSPPKTQPPPYNPDDWGLPPARQENDDVFPGFRGNNEA